MAQTGGIKDEPSAKKLILNAFFMNQPSYVAPGIVPLPHLRLKPELMPWPSQESGDTRGISNGDITTSRTG